MTELHGRKDGEGMSPAPASDERPSAREDEPGSLGHEPPPPGAHFMNGVRWTLFVALLILAAVSITSYVVSRRSKTVTAVSAKKALYYCPMHPSYTSDKPGECPICGMSLEPMPASGTPPGPAGAAGEGNVPGLTSVHLSPERVQMIGVRTVRVELRPLGGALELVGFVAPDESRYRRVQIRASGWVQKLFVSRTGEPVRAGQPLLSIYSPELYQSEQEFLIEGAGMDSVAHGAHEVRALQAARERLRLLGVPEGEIARLERERTASTRLTLRAPVGGTVLERGVAEGQYVGADTPLFTLADLSRVWVLADLYEMDVSRVVVGDRARFTADALPGQPLYARVEFIYPTVSTETRTVKLRLSLANLHGALRPGMYGRVQVIGHGPSRLAVPAEAVVNTGEHNYVFVAHAGGHFEPRMVRVGFQEDDWVQILNGVAAGDTVVASASFLIDSESRLKAAIAGMGQQPSTGHSH